MAAASSVLSSDVIELVTKCCFTKQTNDHVTSLWSYNMTECAVILNIIRCDAVTEAHHTVMIFSVTAQPRV